MFHSNVNDNNFCHVGAAGELSFPIESQLDESFFFSLLYSMFPNEYHRHYRGRRKLLSCQILRSGSSSRSIARVDAARELEAKRSSLSLLLSASLGRALRAVQSHSRARTDRMRYPGILMP